MLENQLGLHGVAKNREFNGPNLDPSFGVTPWPTLLVFRSVFVLGPPVTRAVRRVS